MSPSPEPQSESDEDCRHSVPCGEYCTACEGDEETDES